MSFEIPIYDALLKKDIIPYRTVECHEKWVGESLENEIEKWVPPVLSYISMYQQPVVLPSPEPVLINAPTGMGKTTFILEHLAKFAEKRNQWILILSNRLALNMQFKQILSDKYGPNIGTTMLEDVNTFGKVTLCTYQSALSFFASYQGYDPLFVVCDEAHFFCSDAVFNAWTEEILASMMFRFRTSCRIYMSATPEDVKPVIAVAEYLLQQAKYNKGSFNAAKYQHWSIREYYFQNTFENISLSFFVNWDTVTDRIKTSKDNSKWLIFVSSKDKGKELKDCLPKDVADYVDSSFRSREDTVMEDLTRRQRFDNKVLICTSVLDNGISIVDDSLKEIVVDSLNSVEMIQAVGRKRMRNGEKVHIWVRIPGKETVTTYLNTNEKLYDRECEFEKNAIAFVYKYWGNMSGDEQKLFRIEWQTSMVAKGCQTRQTNSDIFEYKGQVVPIQHPVFRNNSIAKYQLGRKSKELEELKDEMSIDPDAYAKKVCELFHKEFSLSMYEDGKGFELVAKGLTNILEEYVGKDIDNQVGMKEIDERLQKYYSENPVPSCNLTLKKDGNRSAEHINEFIKMFKLPFSLSKKGERVKNCYFISKKESKD